MHMGRKTGILDRFFPYLLIARLPFQCGENESMDMRLRTFAFPMQFDAAGLTQGKDTLSIDSMLYAVGEWVGVIQTFVGRKGHVLKLIHRDDCERGFQKGI